MEAAPTLSTDWVLWLVSEFAAEPRRHSGETDDPYADPTAHPESPAEASGYGVSECVAVADAAFAVFAASPDKEAMATALQALLAEPVEVRPTVVDQQIVLRFSVADSFALGPEVARCLVETLADHRVRDIGTCEADHCVDVYVDRSRQHNRRFCSTICQVRTRVARHRDN